MTAPMRIELGNCYRIAGRTPIVVTSVTYYSNSKRTGVRGYTLPRYKQYLKFHTINTDTFKSQAEEEGIDTPEITEFRFNSTSKIERVNIKKDTRQYSEDYVLNGLETLTTDELDRKLAQPRKELPS